MAFGKSDRTALQRGDANIPTSHVRRVLCQLCLFEPKLSCSPRIKTSSFRSSKGPICIMLVQKNCHTYYFIVYQTMCVTQFQYDELGSCLYASQHTRSNIYKSTCPQGLANSKNSTNAPVTQAHHCSCGASPYHSLSGWFSQPPALETYKPIYTPARMIYQKCKRDHVIPLLKCFQLPPTVHILKSGLLGKAYRAACPAPKTLPASFLHSLCPSCTCLGGVCTGFSPLFLCDLEQGYSPSLKHNCFLSYLVYLENYLLGNLFQCLFLPIPSKHCCDFLLYSQNILPIHYL